MTVSREAMAEAFSSHHFADAYPHLAQDVRWILVGGPTITGRQAVIDTCEETLRELAQTATQFINFRAIVGADSVVVDAIGQYDSPDESTSTVASCDIFDFVDDSITAITSYTVELPAG